MHYAPIKGAGRTSYDGPRYHAWLLNNTAFCFYSQEVPCPCYTIRMGFLKALNVARQCREEYNVSLWKCPSFLFVLMGIIVIVSIMITYFTAAYYNSDPEVGAFIALVTAAIILVIGRIIIESLVKALEVDKLKTQFLNIMSHHLLTPLTALKWSVSAIESDESGSDKEKLEEALGIIKENGNKMIAIINTLLDVSRIESGKVSLSPERMDMRALTEEVIATHKEELEQSGHTVEWSAAGSIPPVLGDPKRVRMVIDNLLDNAMKFSPPHSTIAISLWSKGEYVVCEMEDKGVGIPTHERKYIFSRFFRSEKNETSLRIKGLGVGLFLVKCIIEASGGKVRFESREHIGSKFWFSLPVYKI